MSSLVFNYKWNTTRKWFIQLLSTTKDEMLDIDWFKLDAEYSGHKCHYHLVIRWYIYVWLKFSPHQLSIEFNCFFFHKIHKNETRIRNFYHSIYFIFVWNKWMFFSLSLVVEHQLDVCMGASMYSCCEYIFFTWDCCFTALLINIENYCVIINHIWPSYANLGFPFKWSKSQLNEVRQRERAR